MNSRVTGYGLDIQQSILNTCFVFMFCLFKDTSSAGQLPLRRIWIWIIQDVATAWPILLRMIGKLMNGELVMIWKKTVMV
jgi:hypothetical protein